jgi:hypothetical protein
MPRFLSSHTLPNFDGGEPMKLTVSSTAALKLPAGKRDHIEWDADIGGFGLRLRDGGKRAWVFQYKTGSQQRRMTFGSYPAMPVPKARERAAEQEGLDRDTAMRLASRTVAGAGALMLETGETAGDLRKQVTSPGGTTEAALDVLGGNGGLAPLLRHAVSAAAARSRELGRG